MKHILYQLAKFTDLYNFAESRIDKLNIAEKFFTEEAPELIKELERGCGYNGKTSA